MSASKLPISGFFFSFLCLALLITVQCTTIDSVIPQFGDILSNVCGIWQTTNSNCSFNQASIIPVYSNGSLNTDSLGMLLYDDPIFLTKSTQGTTWTVDVRISPAIDAHVSIDMSGSQATFTVTTTNSDSMVNSTCSLARGNPNLISGTWVRDSNINSTSPMTYEITVINNTYMMVTADSNVTNYLVTIDTHCLNGNCSYFDCDCGYYDPNLQTQVTYFPGMQLIQLGYASILYYLQNGSSYQEIFPVGTWENTHNIPYNCCTPNSIVISPNTEPATQNELNIQYNFSPNITGSPACASIAADMVDNVLTSTIEFSFAKMNWGDTKVAFTIFNGYYSDTSDQIDNGTIISGNFEISDPTEDICSFVMTLQGGPKPNSEPHLANWKLIYIIYGIFICFVVLH